MNTISAMCGELDGDRDLLVHGSRDVQRFESNQDGGPKAVYREMRLAAATAPDRDTDGGEGS